MNGKLKGTAFIRFFDLYIYIYIYIYIANIFTVTFDQFYFFKRKIKLLNSSVKQISV